MKKLYTLCALLTATIGITRAQYTITKDNMPNIYTVEVKANDTMPDASIVPGNSGANRIWDLSKLKNQKQDSTVFLAPAATPYANRFPKATLAGRTNDTTYVYATVTDKYLGIMGVATSKNTTVINPSDKIFVYPATYQTAYTDTQNTLGKAGFKKILGRNLPFMGKTYDSLRVTAQQVGTNAIDAYGPLTTPAKIFANALRMMRFAINTPSLVEYRDSATKQWAANAALTTALKTDKKDTTTTYEWYSQDNRVAVASIVYKGSNNKLQKATYLKDLRRSNGLNDLSANKKGVIVFPNPTKDELFIIIDNQEATTLKIYDISGRLIDLVNLHADKHITLNTSSYNQGIYLYKVLGNNGKEMITEKFIVARH